MKVYNPSREERAFLYQEAQSLELLIKNLGSLTVLVEQNPAHQDFRVTFMVAPETVGMRVQATDSNLFSATMAAKAETERQLNALVNALPRAHQEDQTDQTLPSENLH